MATSKRLYSKEEIARRGDEIYESVIQRQLKADDNGKFVAIDVDTGTYGIDPNEVTACNRLKARIAGAQIWLMRAGSRYAHRFGGHELRANP
ncbi:MAG TPA: hypothetical protein VGZ25_02115 [Gemmataceae bacterium]|jgi:hypothetical protein|nr:hypothetical protein [Gemmataceae bacterium]